MPYRGSNVHERAVVEGLEERRLLAVFSVTSAADSGVGSLRDAINSANRDTVADTIQFRIGQGGSTARVALASPLPTITSPVTIDGTTQAGTTGYNGTPLIQLYGAGAGAGASGLTITGGSSTVRGLIIGGFSANGIYVQGGAGNNVFENDYLGTDGVNVIANGQHGLILTGDGNRVGGIGALKRNVISGNSGYGIYLAGSNAVIQGNYIGTDAQGANRMANQWGVYADTGGTRVTIGGAAAGEGNVISGDAWFGVQLNADGGTIVGNNFGFDATRSYPINYGIGGGVAVYFSASHTISGNFFAGNERGVYVHAGRNTLIQQNEFRGNTESGVSVDDATSAGISIRTNVMVGSGNLGIDLVESEALRKQVTPNTPGGPHAGPNHLQNFPVLGSAVSDGYATTVTGTLNSDPNATFTVDLYNSPFAGASGNGEGSVYLGSVAVRTDASGNGSFAAKLTAAATSAQSVVSATATAPDGSTSEFSLAKVVGSAPPPAVAASSAAFAQYPHTASFRFTERVKGSVDTSSLVIRNAATGATFAPDRVSYDDATDTATFVLPPTLADGNYNAVLLGQRVTNAARTPVGADVTLPFFEFRGDVNRDRTVDFNDLVPLAQNYNKVGGQTLATGDFTGDGTTDFNDLVQLAQRYNTTLKASGAAVPAGDAVAGGVAADVLLAAFAGPSTPTGAALPATRLAGPLAGGEGGRVAGGGADLEKDSRKPVFSAVPVVRPVAVKRTPVKAKAASRRH